MVFWLLMMCKHDRAAVSCCGCIITYSFVWPNSKNQPIDSMLCTQSIKYWRWDGIIEVFQKSKNKLWYFIADDVKYDNSDTFCIWLNQSQHEDLKMQYYELQEKHQNQGQHHERVLDEHRLELDNLQREKEVDISRLKGESLCYSCMHSK